MGKQTDVEQHYCVSGRLAADIDAKLISMGKVLGQLGPEDLEAIDQFHIRGHAATMELAEMLSLPLYGRVLDVGSGLGGPARAIARDFHCRVTGIDLTRDFCEAAKMLSRWTGLSDVVAFIQGDATTLDLTPASFDAVVTMHAAMNIRRKDAMYAGIRRALKAGGRFGIYDVVAGEGGPVLYPVPWARDVSISHLVSKDDMRSLLRGAGFVVEMEIDTTEASAAWFEEKLKRLQNGGSSPLSFQLFLGAQHADMIANQVRNLKDRRIRTVMWVASAA